MHPTPKEDLYAINPAIAMLKGPKGSIGTQKTMQEIQEELLEGLLNRTEHAHGYNNSLTHGLYEESMELYNNAMKRYPKIAGTSLALSLAAGIANKLMTEKYKKQNEEAAKLKKGTLSN